MKKGIINIFRHDYSFLSNFYRSSIEYQGDVYSTAEHLFQALKTKSKRLREQIRIAKTPSSAKKLGRRIILRKDWETIKYKLMYMVVRLKFQQDSKLTDALLDTEKHTLVEENYWHDNIWGSCICHKCKQIEGENHLGKILMKVRNII